MTLAGAPAGPLTRVGDGHEPLLAQVTADIDHWRVAAGHLADLDSMAAPEAWARLESYIGQAMRHRLRGVAATVSAEAERLLADANAASGPDLALLRARQLDLRRRYLQAETVIDLYGDAVNTRTSPVQGALLRALDVLAADSLQAVLRPLGLEPPPVLTYVDKGEGASILRAGVRLWDRGSPSPVALMKITRHSLLGCPTSILHETGHQAFHQAGWGPELADALGAEVAAASPLAAAWWRSWASELAADVHAFVLAGYGPVPALATVVDGSTSRVFALRPGDPHPFGWIRVLFNVALCRLWYGPGPWDGLELAWRQRHDPARVHPDARSLARISLPLLPRLAEVCTRRPMAAFGGRALSGLVDPLRVSPDALETLARRSGPALYTSEHLQRQESLRILAWSALRLSRGPADPGAGPDLAGWLRRLGGERPAAIDDRSNDQPTTARR